MPTRRLPSDPNLEQLKNHAKTLQRRARAGDSDALDLVREFHPRLNALDLDAFSRADAQLVLARLYGFASWPKLRRHVELVGRYSRSPHRQPVGGPIDSEAERADELLRLACLTYDGAVDGPMRWGNAQALLAERPELAAANIYTAAAVGDVGAARDLLAEDPARARREGGPHRWEPLLYLAYSRLDSTAPGHSTLEVARLLLEHGADPNAGYLWEGLADPFTALTGAFGRGEGDPPPHQYELDFARLLLEHSADPNDSQTLYNRSWVPGDEWLELLFEFGLGTGSGGPWHARLGPQHSTPREMLEDQLCWATLYNLPSRVRLLLRHGVDPDGRGTSHPIMQGRSALEQALLDGNDEIAEALLAAGATPVDLDPVQELAAACMRGDREAVETLLAAHPGLGAAAAAHEPQLIVRAAELGRGDVVRLLREIGFDVNYLGRMTALHQAAFDGDLELVKLLLELGADPTARDKAYDATPLGWAQHNNKQEVADYLAGLAS